MKRDMDLIRAILLYADSGESDPLAEQFSKKELAYHVWLLKDAGFLNAMVAMDEKNEPHQFHITNLTWQGHEFLDAMRDNGLWKQAKEKFIKPGASWTAKAVFEYLKIEVTRRMTGG